MKKFFLLFLLLVSFEAKAQNYSVRKKVDKDSYERYDSASYNHVFKAGEYLSASGRAQFCAIGLTGLTGITSYLAVKNDNAVLKGMSIVSGIGAFTSAMLAINFKLKAGKELRISAGEIVLKF